MMIGNLDIIKEKEIARLLDQGKVVVIGEEEGLVIVNIENNGCVYQ